MIQVQSTQTIQMPVSSFLNHLPHRHQIQLPPSRTLVSDRLHLRNIIDRVDRMAHRIIPNG